MVHDNLTG